MTKPLIPADEARRLQTLRNPKLLDTPPEERFDRMTRLARRLFGVPIAVLSLIDKDRQWFKSRQGLDTIETSRENSFCGHAITEDRVLVINDASKDERFSDNPLVTGEPNIRFYAACPINAPNTSRIGALGIIDREPRELTDEELILLRELGRMIDEELATASPATNDSASGLSNRRGLAMLGKHLLSMCRRTNTPASLLLVRFANLATIDESFGYNVGNYAVTELVELLKASFRDADLIGRSTIDSFGVLYAGSVLEDVELAWDRFDELLGDRNSGDRDYELKVRKDGVTYNPGRHSDVEKMLQEVEHRLDNPSYDEVLEPIVAEAAAVS